MLVVLQEKDQPRTSGGKMTKITGSLTEKGISLTVDYHH